MQQMDSKLKSNKHYSNKLPDVFRNGFNKDKQRKQSERSAIDKDKQEQKPIPKVEKTQPKSNKRQSKNPFIPIHDWLRMSKQMDEKISSVRQGFEMQRLSKLSFESSNIVPKEEKKTERIKSEDCLTLTTFKKKQESSCVKKILHVPTLTVYYLRQSVIDLSIGKHDLEEWIHKTNEQVKNGKSSSQEIIELYWNTPEGYYSILYEYVDGTFLQATLDNLYSFPLNFIQSIIEKHLNEDIQIYNSQLIIQRNTSEIAYLPIYEETPYLTNNYRNFIQLFSLNGECSGIEIMEKKIVARLGFFVALLYFGEAIVDEDILNVLFQTQNDCCLIHKLLANPSSLISIYVGVNFQSKSRQKDYLIDFLCRSLKFNSKARATFAELRKHKFLSFKNSNNQLYSMNELTSILQSAGQSSSNRSLPSRELSLHKMNKILESMALILQGVRDSLEVNLSPANKNIEFLVRDIGLGVSEGEVQIAKVELVKKLKKIYKEGKSDLIK